MSGRWVLRRKVRVAVATAVGLLAPLTGALVTPAHAATVSCPSANLQTAINAAPPGSTIHLSGTCIGQFVINKSLRLVGLPATLDGANGGTVVSVGSGANVRFDALTIQHGRGFQGGILNQGTLALYNTTVRQNTAVSTLPLVQANPLDCVADCTAVDGGIHTIHNAGGGISNLNGKLTLNASTVTQNSASGSYSVNQFNSLTCSATCTVTQRNLAIGSAGGGIFNFGGQVALNQSVVSGNSAVASGDATQTNSANCTGGCTVTQSNVLIAGAGGGVFNHQGSLAVNDSTVSGNSASSTVFSIQDNTGNCGCSQIDEISIGGGAGIFNDGTATISSSTLANNTGGAGGGIFNASGATATATSSMIGGNSAGVGGGVYNNGTFSLQTSTVSRNTASVSGGGVFNRGAFAQAASIIVGNVPDNCFGC